MIGLLYNNYRLSNWAWSREVWSVWPIPRPSGTTGEPLLPSSLKARAIISELRSVLIWLDDTLPLEIWSVEPLAPEEKLPLKL